MYYDIGLIALKPHSSTTMLNSLVYLVTHKLESLGLKFFFVFSELIIIGLTIYGSQANCKLHILPASLLILLLSEFYRVLTGWHGKHIF